MSEHWSSSKEAGALSGMRFMVGVYNLLGRGVFTAILVPVIAYFFIRRGSARQASMDYLRRFKRAYPEKFRNQSIIWLSYRHFLAFGQSILDKYIVWASKTTEITLPPPDRKLLFDQLESGEGCLLVGSHFGNLEYSRGIAVQYPELVINVLIHDQHSEKFSALMKDADTDSRMNLIQVTDIDFDLALSLKEKVDRGEWVAIAADRVPVGERKRVCSVDFLGDKANFPVGPYVLASLLNCPVYLLHCYYAENQYHVGVEFFGKELKFPRKNRQQAYADAAQKYAIALQRQVARFPLQWFNFFDFWNTDNTRELTRKGTDENV
jgi:predicted LPLAT superfamily acyltransferase